MKINLHTQRVTEPAAFVTKGRQRVKQYDNHIVYLKNGDEFEIELFNPTTSKILAKINLNGKSLGSGIVLRPGERVFLERYFDESRKFLFETYEIDSNDSDAKEAIKLNGKVEIEFFNEYFSNSPTFTWSSRQIIYPDNYDYYTYTSNTGVKNIQTNVLNETNTMYSMSCNSDTKSSKIETGIIEKGSTSNQSFSYDSTSFNSFSSWKSSWTILPESQKLLAKEDLKVFCANCGSKRKKTSHRFCPNCGQKF